METEKLPSPEQLAHIEKILTEPYEDLAELAKLVEDESLDPENMALPE